MTDADTKTDDEEREDERDADADAESDGGAAGSDRGSAPVRSSGDARPGAGTRTLGLERYVQFGFILGGGVLFWLLDKIILLVWDVWAEPPTTVVTAIAFASAVGVAIGLYFHPKLNQLAMEVGGELSKVTWPTRKETSAATVVVLVTSVIAAVYLGVLDFFWSAITDLIYQTKA